MQFVGLIISLFCYRIKIIFQNYDFSSSASRVLPPTASSFAEPGLCPESGIYCFPFVGSRPDLILGSVSEDSGSIGFHLLQTLMFTRSSHSFIWKFSFGLPFSWYWNSRKSVPRPDHTLCTCQMRFHTFGENQSWQNLPSRFRSSSSWCGYSLGLAFWCYFCHSSLRWYVLHVIPVGSLSRKMDLSVIMFKPFPNPSA